MTQGASGSSDNARRQQIIAEYLHQRESGAEPNQQSIIEQHPDLAGELRAFFAQCDPARTVANSVREQELDRADNPEFPTVPPSDANSGRLPPPSDTPSTSESPTIAPSELPHGSESVASPRGTKVRYFGDYELLEEIARGGMGVVYKARQVSLNRIVALKMILAGQLASEDEVQRFHTEAEAAAKLDHPGIVPIHEVGEHEGQHYFSMGYVDGQSLAEKLAEGPLPSKEAADLTHKLAQSIAYAHEQGVIHRDLKPANVLLDKYGQPRITDFGLAKKMEADSNLTGTGQILGTPSYMPPEQAAGQSREIGPAADVYALGAVLYTMLTGRPPFQAANPMDTLLQVLDKEPMPLRQLDVGIPRDLETLCLKCLEKEPDRRYPSAQELCNEVDRFLKGEPIQARPLSAPARTWRWYKRNPVVASLAVTVAILLLILGIAGPIVAFKQTMLARVNQQLADDERDARTKESDARKSAVQKSRELEQQLHIATAMRLAAQSQGVGARMPVQSLLLGIEAVDATRRYGELVVPIAHEALLNSLATVGGTPLVGHASHIRLLTWSPDGRWLVTASGDRTVRLWNQAARARGHSALVLRGLEGVDITGCVAISPNSRWLAMASDNATVRLCDLAVEDPSASPRALSGHAGRVSSIVVTQDSRWLVTGSEDKTVRIWDLAAADPAASPLVLPHNTDIDTLAIGPNNRWLFTANRCIPLSQGGKGQDKIAQLWNLHAEEPTASLIELEEAEGIVVAISPDATADNVTFQTNRLRAAISPDGAWLATGGNQMIRLWNLMAGDPTASPVVLEGGADEGLAFSPDGRWLVTAGRRGDAAARFWDLRAEDPATSPRILPMPGAVGTGSFRDKVAIKISPDGRWLAVASDARGDRVARLCDLKVEDPTVSQIVLRGHEAAILSVAFSPDSRRLVTTSSDASARVWDLTVPDPGDSPLVLRGHENKILSAAISPDSHHVATADDGKVRLWKLNAEDPDMSPVLWGHEQGVRSVEYSPDGRWLVTASEDTARLWDLTGECPEYSPRVLSAPNSDALSVAVDPHGRWIVTVSKDSTVRLWDLTVADPATSPRLLSTPSREIGSMAVSSNGRWLVTAFSGYGRRSTAPPLLWDLTATGPAASPRELRASDILSTVYQLAISPNGRWLATGNSDKIVRLWDLTAEDPVASLPELHGHESIVNSLAFSPDGRCLATGSNDKTARLWDLTAIAPAADPLVLRGHTTSVTTMAFHPDGRRLATGSYNGTARLWDLGADDPAASPGVFTGHSGRINSIVITPDGRWLATASQDNTARLWDLKAADPAATSLVLWEHTGPIHSMAISPDARCLVTGSEDKTARRWDLDINSLLDRARRIADRHLTPKERRQFLLDDPTTQLAGNWTVLRPVEMTSAGGAWLTLQSDDSILATGPNADNEVYTITAHVEPQTIHALRLEVLPLERLPRSGPGRSSSGNFRLTEIHVSRIPREARTLVTPVVFANVTTDHLRAGRSVADVIDSDHKTYWDVYPHTGMPHCLVLEPDCPISLSQGQRLTIKLHFAHPGTKRQNLGHFRVSVANRAQPQHWLARAIRNGPLGTTLSARTRLRCAYLLNGKLDKAVEIPTQTASESSPSNACDMFLLSLGYKRLGCEEEARQWYLRAMEWMLYNNADDFVQLLARDLMKEMEALSLSEAQEQLERISQQARIIVALKIKPGNRLPKVIVPAESTWKWLHPTDGLDPASQDIDFHTTFFISEYDDAVWQMGQDSSGPEGGFGYGHPPSGVSIGVPESGDRKTAYFRHIFRVDEGFDKLAITMQRDDGVIVYLDGNEVVRNNIAPDRPDAYGLLAEMSVQSEAEPNTFQLAGGLEPGEHVLAISLHNLSADSSDLRIAEISLWGTSREK